MLQAGIWKEMGSCQRTLKKVVSPLPGVKPDVFDEGERECDQMRM